MPIDDLIASGIRPPQVEDPTTVYGRLLQIQSARQQQQLASQAVESGKVDLRLKQQGEQDQQTIRQAYMESGGDPAKFKALVMQRGASPAAIQQIEQHQLTMRKSYADLGKVELENETNRHEALRGELQSYLGQAPEYKAANWQPWVQSHVANGRLTPQEGADLLKQYPQYPGDEQGKLYSNGLTTGIQLAKEAAAEKEAAARVTTADTGRKRLEIETPGIQAQNTTRALGAAGQSVAGVGNQAQYDTWRAAQPEAIRNTIPAFYSPAAVQMVERAGMTADQRAQVDQQAANLQNTKDYQRKEIGIRQAELGVARERVGIEQKKFEATFGSGLDANGQPVTGPDGKPLVSPQAQAIADGTYDAQTARAVLRRSPGIIAQIKAVDPNFNQLTLDKRQDTLKEFTNTTAGHAGGQALALNTLIHHADLYLAAAEALKNGTFRPGNAVYNAVATAFGSAPPTNAALIGRFFASETGKVATGGVPAEGEVNGILKNLSTDGSPDQLKQAGETLLGIAAGRMRPLQETADDAQLGKLVQVLKPDARDILTRRGFDPATMRRGNGAAGNGPGGRPSLDSFWKKQ